MRVPLHIHTNLMLNDRTRAAVLLQHWVKMIQASGPGAHGFRAAPGTSPKRIHPRKGRGRDSRLSGLQGYLNGLAVVARYSK